MLKVWDPFVRFYHWAVVLSVSLNLWILDEGKYAHRMVGYIVVGLVIARLAWGVVGTRYARFRSFIPSRIEFVSYIGQLRRGKEPRYIGHNPLGSVMMLALWATLLALGLTGWMQKLDMFWGVDWVEDVHGALANFLIVLIMGHVAGAVFESIRHHENLILSMVTGRKRE